MPRSFLITKLQKRKDNDDVDEDRTASDDDEQVVDVSSRRLVDDVDLTTQVHGLSTDFENVAADISDRADERNSLTDFTGTSTTTV